MECSDLGRTGVSGLDRSFVINIDHHPGNTGFGQLMWFDSSAAACGEMVFDLVKALGVPLSREIATHVYLAILTDTGSFHYSSISPAHVRDLPRDLEAGVDPVLVARNVYDSNSMGGSSCSAPCSARCRSTRPAASPSSISITTWRARPAAPTKTPKG
jgi:phosphoesterase RecJ-like protein